MMKTFLQVEDMRTSFYARADEMRAVDGVTFHINLKDTFGLVGESSCGKIVTGWYCVPSRSYPHAMLGRWYPACYDIILKFLEVIFKEFVYNITSAFI